MAFFPRFRYRCGMPTPSDPHPGILDDLRRKIDHVDDKIVDLLAERFKLISELSEIKKRDGLSPYQIERERDILKRVVERGGQNGLNRLLLQALFLQIFAVSKREQSQ